MNREPWFCPACQRHHAPHVETCPKPVDLIGQPLPIGPIYPLPVVFDPCAGCKGPCGNVACPKRMQITCAAGALPINDSVSYSIGTVGTAFQ